MADLILVHSHFSIHVVTAPAPAAAVRRIVYLSAQVLLPSRAALACRLVPFYCTSLPLSDPTVQSSSNLLLLLLLQLHFTTAQLYPILPRLSSTPADSAGWPDRPVHSLGQRADFGGWSGAVFQAGGRYTCLRLESDPAGEGGGEELRRERERGREGARA